MKKNFIAFLNDFFLFIKILSVVCRAIHCEFLIKPSSDIDAIVSFFRFFTANFFLIEMIDSTSHFKKLS